MQANANRQKMVIEDILSNGNDDVQIASFEALA
jgi:hypothetical protein